VNIVEFRQRLAASSRDDVDAIVEQFRQEAKRRQSFADLATLGLPYDGVVRLRGSGRAHAARPATRRLRP